MGGVKPHPSYTGRVPCLTRQKIKPTVHSFDFCLTWGVKCVVLHFPVLGENLMSIQYIKCQYIVSIMSIGYKPPLYLYLIIMSIMSIHIIYIGIILYVYASGLTN